MTFDDFSAQVRKLVESDAAAKGYNQTGTDGANDLLQFTSKFFPSHAAGEIVYKAVRYSHRGDKTDLLKIAAWAYLLWRQDHERH